jgi:hypothetical protein
MVDQPVYFQWLGFNESQTIKVTSGTAMDRTVAESYRFASEESCVEEP